MNEYDIIFKFGSILTVLFGIITPWKAFIEIYRGRRSDLREEYKFAKGFFYDIKQNSEMHHFLKQKGYQAIAGNTRVTSAEIEYLLTFSEPVQYIRYYVSSRQCLEFLVSATDSKIAYRGKLKHPGSRKRRKIIYFMLYVVFSLLGYSPIMLPAFHLLPLTKALIAFIFSALLYFPLAIFMLMEGRRISLAEKIIKNQP